MTKAFSSEMETVSRQENASNQESRAFSSEVEPVRVKKTRQNKESGAPFLFDRNGKGYSAVDIQRRIA